MKSPPGAAVFEFATTVLEVTGVAFTTFTFVRFVLVFVAVFVGVLHPTARIAEHRIMIIFI
jgi:hypothetical protein